MARFLLDTQALIVLAEEPQDLSRKTRAILGDIANELFLSSVSITELAIKKAINKVRYGREEITDLIRDLHLTVLPYTDVHAIQLFRLPLHHRDPFDRMLIATAIAEGVPIVTSDREFEKYRGLKVIW